ncbi:flap endonuclease-1 [Candidatus Bathyarchaeota archaeon]|nr:flap endonuclease-1 [Candidatus Bathyarchaeota archaeon]
MGVNLTPIIVKDKVSLNAFRGKSLAVDANNMLYQFLSVIRLDYGIPLQGSKGRSTSHLGGLMSRSTRLICDYDIKLVFVFDGEPPKLKLEELKRRSLIRFKAKKEWEKAVASGDREQAFSKAVTSTRLTRDMIEDAKKLLRLLGIPYVESPGEGEAQAAHMAEMGRVWAANSRDYDSILFGVPRLARYVTISGSEYLQSKGISRKLVPEIIYLAKFLDTLGINQEQLIDLAILVGTDYNMGVRGIGPKMALRLIQKHQRLERLPSEIGSQIPDNIEEVRSLFKEPKVRDDYSTNFTSLDEEGLRRFLVEERDYSEERVDMVIARMNKFYSTRKQTGLYYFFPKSEG